MPAERHLRPLEIERHCRLDHKPGELRPAIPSVRSQPADGHMALAALIIVRRLVRSMGVNVYEKLLQSLLRLNTCKRPLLQVGKV